MVVESGTSQRQYVICYDNPIMDDMSARIAKDMTQFAYASGLSQAAFARALGTSGSRYSTYTTGAVTPRADSYLRAKELSQALTLARKSGMTTPIDAAEAIKTNLRADTQGHAWRWMLEASAASAFFSCRSK